MYFPWAARPGVHCPRVVNTSHHSTVLQGPPSCHHHEALPPPITRCVLSAACGAIYSDFSKGCLVVAAYSLYYYYFYFYLQSEHNEYDLGLL